MEEYDDVFKSYVDTNVTEMECESYLNDDECMNIPITYDEILHIYVRS